MFQLMYINCGGIVWNKKSIALVSPKWLAHFD